MQAKLQTGLTVSTKTGIGLDLDEEEPKEIGKANTEKMLAKWTADTDTEKSNNDIWGQIGENSNWFIPSKDEWLAFADAFDIDSSNYSTTYKLSLYYWSSSQDDADGAWYVTFAGDKMRNTLINRIYSVRMSATF